MAPDLRLLLAAMLRTSCPAPLNEEDDRTNIERTTRLLEQVTGHRPVNSLCLDRTRRRLVVHEHEIIRLAEKAADRAARPDQSGDAGQEFALEGSSRYRVFPRPYDIGREFVLTVDDGKGLRVDDIVLGAERIDRGDRVG
jgi:hypothetical protein